MPRKIQCTTISLRPLALALALACCATAAGAQTLPTEAGALTTGDVANLCAVGMGNMALNHVATSKPATDEARERAATMFVLSTYWMQLAPMTDASMDRTEQQTKRLTAAGKAKLQEYCTQVGMSGLRALSDEDRKILVKVALEQMADALAGK